MTDDFNYLTRPIEEPPPLPRRTQKVRIFIIQEGTAEPVTGVPVTVVAELADTDSDFQIEIPIAVLESDRCGYLSVDLGKLSQARYLTHVWLRPYNDRDLQFDAFPIIDIKADPAIVTLPVMPRAVARKPGRSSRDAVIADEIDALVSRESLVNSEMIILGEGGCEELLHSRQSESTFRFVQLVRDTADPQEFQKTDEDDCDFESQLAAGPGVIASTAPAVDQDFTTRCYRHGEIFEYEITWKPLGHALGRILYSLPLAPCESVDIAIIDWQRRDRTLRSEDTSISEQLAHVLHRDRDIEETVSASLRESQLGGSFMTGTAGAASGSFKMIDFGGTAAIGGALAGTRGKRKLQAKTVQTVSDNISQATSAMRRLNSTVVAQVSSAEKEVIQTRTVTNHNHCHALTMLYYEVLRLYLVSVRYIDRRNAIFVRYRPVNDFHAGFQQTFTEELVFHNRRILKSVLRDPMLECGFAAIVKSLRKKYNPGSSFPTTSPEEYNISAVEVRFTTGEGTVYAEDEEGGTRAGGNIYEPVRVWLVTVPEDREIPLLRTDEYRWHANPSGELQPYELGGYSIDEMGSSDATMAFTTDQEDIFILQPSEPIRWDKVAWIEIEARPESWELKHLQIRTQHGDYVWVMLDEEVDHTFRNDDTDGIRRWPVRPFDATVEDLNLSANEIACKQGLIAHLNYHKLYYSRAIWLAQDAEERARAFEHYTLQIDGVERRLTDVIENRIAGISGDYLAFPSTFSDESEEGESQGDESAEDTEMRVISLPTRGVFAEAKLSHCNACEERDITRYWDWTESPCPEPPAIGEIQAGQQDVTDPPEGTPTTMPSPVINIVNPPNIPDPTGLAAALEVMRTPDIFRDMSAVDQLSDLLQELVEGAVTLVQARQRAREIVEGSGRSSTPQSGGQGPTAPRQESPSALHDRRSVIENAIDRGVQQGAISDEQAKEYRGQMVEKMVGTMGDKGGGSKTSGFFSSTSGSSSLSPGTISTSNINRVWSWAPLNFATSEVLRNQTLQRVSDLGITDLVIQLNDANNASGDAHFEFNSGNSLENVRRGIDTVLEGISERGLQIDIHFQMWPAPRQVFMTSAADQVLQLCDRFSPRSLLFDAEGPWNGGAGHSDIIRDVIEPRFVAHPVALGASDFLNPLRANFAHLASVCDYVLPQAYSITDHEHVSERAPVTCQRGWHAAYSSLGKPIVMALNSWNVWRLPDMDVYDTMSQVVAAVDSLIDPVVHEIAYWSIPMAYQDSGRAEITRFLTVLCAGVRSAHPFAAGIPIA